MIKTYKVIVINIPRRTEREYEYASRKEAASAFAEFADERNLDWNYENTNWDKSFEIGGIGYDWIIKFEVIEENINKQ